MRIKDIIISFILLIAIPVQAQIVISGSVYGGGNAGNTGGSSSVTVCAGDLNHVYGGARMADVGGNAFVNIDGENMSGDILINFVYGGNDVSGTIGSGTKPTQLTEVLEGNKSVDNYNAFILTTPERKETTGTGDEETTSQPYNIFIGQLFGGGNGDYTYTEGGDYPGKQPPVLNKTYLELRGGTIAYVYGGGNNATVTGATDICIDNSSAVTTIIPIGTDRENTDRENNKLLKDDNDRLKKMGIGVLGDVVLRDTYQFSRVFGGNNKAEMAITPSWHLKNGKIDNLYSGGNEGDMTSPKGLMLEIPATAAITVNNVYGGCRKADVRPKQDGRDVTAPAWEGYSFPKGLSAHVRILGGDITNVYGGNDISGKVWGGASVGIYHSISGDVYGGGNGSYAYTDKEELRNNLIYGDYYYNPGSSSVDALNAFRPVTESVSIFVSGSDADHPTIIGGSIYCGGNSATLHNANPDADAYSELKIGSHVYADNVFLGNNGVNMIDATEGGVLRKYADDDFSSLDLTQGSQFAKYMEAVAMDIKPRVVFDASYVDYTTYFGSIFGGGNVGSITYDGVVTLEFDKKVIIYNKVVGGCNNANVKASGYNAAYEGGLIGSKDAVTGNKLVMNFNGLKIQPKRWKMEKDAGGAYTTEYALDANGNRQLEWNTIRAATGEDVDPVTTGGDVESSPLDIDRRLKGGNIYGGCYNSGHVNGNVVININASIVDRKGKYAVFDSIQVNEGEAILYDNRESGESFKILERRSGVILDEQGMDPLGRALNVFGGGFGENSEIWGSTTINLNAGYAFQIFGGGEKGVVGKPVTTGGTYTFNGKSFKYDETYSCYVNVKGDYPGVYRGHTNDNDDMAEAEFIYGGSFEAPIAGNTVINLGNGRVFNSFAGSCNADILGHTETYVGRQVKTDGTYGSGFPWVRDHIYCGNDLGGRILRTENFYDRVSDDIKGKVYNPTHAETPKVTDASAYIEYQQGRIDYIFGGCYGYYDYKDSHYKDFTYTAGEADIPEGKAAGMAREGTDFTKPRMESAFVNFKPVSNSRNAVTKIYGAGQGYTGDSDRDIMQDRSYVLIDIPQNQTNFQNMEVFGAGDFSGVGMRNEEATSLTPALNPAIARANTDGVTAAAVIDLMRGQIYAAYGASYREGFTRRTIVNVPTGSTIYFKRLFGGAYGLKNDVVCDVYEANVNYHSGAAVAEGDQTVAEDFRLNETSGQLEFMSGAVFGGNNSFGRTLYSKITIDTNVLQNATSGYSSRVFGGGYGPGSWSQYTEVNLLDGASVYEVYGGGYGGRVLNTQTVKAWQEDLDKDNNEGDPSKLPLDLGEGYTDEGLDCYLVQANPLGKKTNTNVYINKGATVWGYCYGGGLGTTATVSGTTYIGLHGGTVKKDLYAGGWGGSVAALYDVTGDDAFTATANAFVEGGTVRNVYGGGYEGHVGKHDGETVDGKFVAVAGTTEGDRPAKANVVIGIRKDQNIDFNDSEKFPDGYGFYKGVPAIERNAYGAGEGGSVFGSSTLTINNGYIGYRYFTTEPQDNIPYFADGGGFYQEKIHDETYGTGGENARLADCGNTFGGGYDDKSSVDSTNVIMYGGRVRCSMYGGGEIATVGRGKTAVLSGVDRGLQKIYMPGKTHIELYNGYVQRNVFGGGKGYNIQGYGGTNELYTDGYVFGQTEVYIHGGIVGTEEGLADERSFGNVFGGGDVGFVYSKGYFSDKTKSEKEDNPGGMTGSPNHWYYYDENGDLTEDCKVVISPMLQVRPTVSEGDYISYGGKTYKPWDYVPTEYLNTLKGKSEDAAKWKQLFCGDGTATIDPDDREERGVHIYNAVFAGGNVSSNSDKTYANATTVFGNTTATLFDVYHRDFITVGTEHTGGLYGGGNLSMVDGYRELNITNYGTDYYGLNQQISLTAYRDSLTNRERAYFQLEYLCKVTYTSNGKTYTGGVSRISEDEYDDLPSSEKDKWEQYGFCSIYAGRLLNTIQRADLCGVFGSRMVLQGANDRVADIGDKTEYTINRVGELSLNLQKSIAGDTEASKKQHGNYFGIYSVVNYLGNLTSDVKFTDTYLRWDNTDKKEETVSRSESELYTYYTWKTDRLTKRDRNNGTCHNQVALASGVFLELTTENSTKTKKDYGYITGIIELDLINVKKDIEGGGYVYAKNQHGQGSYHSDYENVILSPYNMQNTAVGRDQEARTYKRYTYDDGKDDPTKILDHETSGNFIHKTKRIVDDCFPNNGVYRDEYKASPAHYWYIKGEVYIYDQVVSAYAGSASAYSKEVKIPLTITAGSSGKLKLLNVQPNLYAYYTSSTDKTEEHKIGQEGVKVNNESEVYQLNDVITWWDWHQLSANEQGYFVKETYVNVDTCYVDGTLYPAGTYVLENDASIHSGNTNATAYAVFKTGSHTIANLRGSAMSVDDAFHPSNNISHNTGYVLTFDMDSPKDWDDWYSPLTGSSIYTGDDETNTRIRKEDYKALPTSAEKDKYREGPTFTLIGDNGLYGQRSYEESEIITKEVYTDYTTTISGMLATMTEAERTAWQATQAEVEPAYVALADVGATQKGSSISQSAYNALADKSNYALAMVCTSTIRLGEEEYLLLGDLVSATSLSAIAAKYMAYNNSQANADIIEDADEALAYVKEHLSEAYYCKKAGKYGGQYFEANTNYSAIKAWCSLTEDRDKFAFNYDAFDVLTAPTYPGEGHTAVYDGNNSPLYSAVKPVEYTAVNTETTALTYYYENESEATGTPKTVAVGASISRDEFEKIKNEKKHYTRIDVKAKTVDSETLTVYIAKENFTDHGTPYGEGQDISQKDYNNLTDENKAKTTSVVLNRGTTDEVKYYCYKPYDDVTEGTVIDYAAYTALKNYQEGFTIQGSEPTETTTLYVSRESNARDVTSEKVISVVYQYTYYEADDDGEGISQVNELHVVNIHLQLESGAPEIGPLSAPPTVLPGDKLRLKAPTVNPGLYEVISNGWEMFENETDAYMHRNGVPFTNNATPVYWYQNEKRWVAFYSKTYLGKSYSEPVLVTVANYHDLSDVMADTEHHMYVDHEDLALPGVRNPKIYLDQVRHEGENQLDLLKSFFDLSTGETVAGHAALNTDQVGNSKNLDFILKSNLSHEGSAWSSIGSDTHCFEGTLHGDGYTISGLDNSLFYKLCGEVYNLGVTGSFTGAGVVEKGDGYVENCWISTSNTGVKTTKPVFGYPTRNDAEKPVQIVNSYYLEEDNAANKYINHAENSSYGTTIRKNSTAFYNGEVAYNLNGFYLNKRYYDHMASDSPAAADQKYNYLNVSADGTLTESSSYYPAAASAKYGDLGYVERRYDNIDFIYAGGSIPESPDERQRTKTEGETITTYYVPIWPDDYMFFGQTLTYDYDSSRPHNDTPTHIAKSSGRLQSDNLNNRVYRAPAYYQSEKMGMAHFNLWANLAAYSKPESLTDETMKAAYPNMTAIDFAGHNDNTYTLGLHDNLFYQPVLDCEDGLLSIVNNGETSNLLVYAPSAEVDEKTHDVLNDYFVDPDYTSYYMDDTYRRVNTAPTLSVHGHLVQSSLKATSDHLLVDKQDFNCPISYTFADGKRMWYQRTPDRYVNLTEGWETVSLPFTAELITTQQKGEITHFYSGSRSIDENGTKIGHEYWLREYLGKKTESESTFTATFNYPTAGGSAKTVDNTFLWDYYYNKNARKDANQDTYQRYYESSRNLTAYPLLTAAKPYIVGFPGKTYYEFDLSGEWTAKNTAEAAPAKLDKQVISFVSDPGITVGVSDDEQEGAALDGYIFKPNYSSKAVTGYQLNTNGSLFERVDEPTALVPFRPYFVAGNGSTPAPSRRAVQYITFDSDGTSFAIGDEDPSKEEIGEGGLIFSVRRHAIAVTSSLRESADVRIVSIAGITVANFTIQPGETVETYIPVSGVYIVRAAGGRYQKKLALK
ncbi:MAG: hypothetical protein IJV17_00295 [Prevotella sp.]|nr:hypothetical protein [Prevotella sp.]